MSNYSSLFGFKEINGEPVASNFYFNLIENQCFLKEKIETIPELSSLDKNLLPRYSNQYELGSTNLIWKNIYSDVLTSRALELAATRSPAITFKDEVDSGLSLVSGEFLFWSNSYLPMSLSSSGLKLFAANKTQIEISSTDGGQNSKYQIGGNFDSFEISRTEEEVTTTVFKIGRGSIESNLLLDMPILRELYYAEKSEDFEIITTRDIILFPSNPETSPIILNNLSENYSNLGQIIYIILNKNSIGNLTLKANIEEIGKKPFVLTADKTILPGETIKLINMSNGFYLI